MGPAQETSVRDRLRRRRTRSLFNPFSTCTVVQNLHYNLDIVYLKMMNHELNQTIIINIIVACSSNLILKYICSRLCTAKWTMSITFQHQIFFLAYHIPNKTQWKRRALSILYTIKIIINSFLLFMQKPLHIVSLFHTMLLFHYSLSVCIRPSNEPVYNFPITDRIIRSTWKQTKADLYLCTFCTLLRLFC